MALINLAEAAKKTGWRVWAVNGTPRLIGHSGFVWGPGVNVCVAPESAGSPAGFYVRAIQSPLELEILASYGRAVGAWGKVETWGWTADDGATWGSERARILEVVVDARHAGYIAALAAHYGVPVAKA